MLIFGLTQEIKAQNKQYWGRELAMCWQRLIVELCQHTGEYFGEPIGIFYRAFFGQTPSKTVKSRVGRARAKPTI